MAFELHDDQDNDTLILDFTAEGLQSINDLMPDDDSPLSKEDFWFCMETDTGKKIIIGMNRTQLSAIQMLIGTMLMDDIDIWDYDNVVRMRKNG